MKSVMREAMTSNFVQKIELRLLYQSSESNIFAISNKHLTTIKLLESKLKLPYSWLKNFRDTNFQGFQVFAA